MPYSNGEKLKNQGLRNEINEILRSFERFLLTQLQRMEVHGVLKRKQREQQIVCVKELMKET